MSEKETIKISFRKIINVNTTQLTIPTEIWQEMVSKIIGGHYHLAEISIEVEKEEWKNPIDKVKK